MVRGSYYVIDPSLGSQPGEGAVCFDLDEPFAHLFFPPPKRSNIALCGFSLTPDELESQGSDKNKNTGHGSFLEMRIAAPFLSDPVYGECCHYS